MTKYGIHEYVDTAQTADGWTATLFVGYGSHDALRMLEGGVTTIPWLTAHGPTEQDAIDILFRLLT